MMEGETKKSLDVEKQEARRTSEVQSWDEVIQLVRIQALALFAYLHCETSKATVFLQEYLSQCYEEARSLDKEKVQGLGNKYKENVICAAQQLRNMDRAVAKERLVGGYRKLRDIDRAVAKDKLKSMSRKQNFKFGIICMFTLLVYWISSPSKAVGRGKMSHHPRLCYIRDEKGSKKFEDCEKLLERPTKGKTSWIFIGNEPMFTLFRPLHKLRNYKMPNDPQYPFMHLKGDKNKPTKNKHYFGYEEMDQDLWETAYLDQDKPTEIATDEYGHSACKRCVQTKMTSNTRDLTLENLLVETSRDVFTPTKNTLTTQETITQYIKDNYEKEKTVCIVQIGNFYELENAPWRTSQEYIKYTIEFHKMLQKNACGSLIRLDSFMHSGLKEQIQTLNMLQREALLTDEEYRNGYYIDLSHLTTPTIESYNLPMLQMLFRLMGTPPYKLNA